MTTIELLSRLRKVGIELRVDDDRLRVNAPKNALTPALKEELAARKGEILVFLKSAKADIRTAISPVQPIPKDGPLPLSFAQQRLWFLDQLESSNHYNMPFASRLIGMLDVAILEQSLTEVVRRQEALRTVFEVRDEQPVQIIRPPEPFRVQLIDLRSLPESEREAEARRLVNEEARRPFDLTQGPLLRALLLRLNSDDHVFVLNMHHVVSDMWSTGVLAREVTTLYQAFVTGQPSPLPELRIQYADYAHWQRQWIQDEIYETQLAYWKKQLGGNLPVMDLPIARPRPDVQTFHGARVSFTLNQDLGEKLAALSLQEASTLYMTLLAAFKTLLYRYTGQTDILIGSPIANRPWADVEGLIGFFLNALVLRTDLSGNPTFRELLHRVRETAIGAYAHQDLPFEKLVDELQPKRVLSYNPLFQAMFTLQNVPMSSLETVPELRVSDFSIDNDTARFDLTLAMRETQAGLVGTLEYNTDLFEADTISRVIGHFQTLLESITTNPDRGINDLPILPEAERQQILLDWNQTQAGYPQAQNLPQLFEAQVKRSPEAVAVVCEGHSLTYQELNRQANQLAHYLQSLGVGPDVLVGIYMERSVKLIVALLGILKAGGAYVPLDPIFPPDRLAYMLADSQAQVLLTEKALLSSVPAPQAQLVSIDQDWPAIAAHSHDNPDPDLSPAHLAYVIYTSGSTGKPKGVQVEHRGVINFLASMQREPGLSSHDVLLSVTTLSFDISVLEIFLSLTTGARLVLASRDTAADGPRLAAELHACGATVMQATPTTWRMLIDAGWPGKQDLKVLCGGEAFPPSLANLLLERCAELWNMYGPTETTIWSTIHQLLPGQTSVPIGRPIANTLCYVLDPFLQPVPAGVPGELYLGGDGLARGYLNRPALTAEKFVPNPFVPQPSARLYRTGDLVRYSPTGQLEFLNRIDHQIKLRGFRIELGEIEAVLAQHPDIREAVVVVREDQPGHKRLIGYLIGDNDDLPAGNDIRLFLRGKLPHYMIPDLFIFVDEFPLTPNKKVDRKALPVPDQVKPGPESNYVEPRTPVEEELAKIWSDLLHLERVGIHDNFFELGGHSLLITQVLARLRHSLDLDLPLRSLFEHQTIAELATMIEIKRHQQAIATSQQANNDNLEHMLRLLGNF